MRFVLDASVGLAWVVDANPDPYAAGVQRRVNSGDRATVPAFWQLEISNVLAVVQRRGQLNAKEIDEGLKYYEGFLARHTDIVTVVPSMRELLRKALELGLTSYDAMYIDLALTENLPLATLDKGLRAAAVKAGVALLK
jgi:predicted nucleic acid-binding protein